MTSQVWGELHAILVDLCEPGVAITPESSLTGKLGLDSVALMSLIVGIESEFDIGIGGEDIAAGILETPGALCEFIEAKRA